MSVSGPAVARAESARPVALAHLSDLHATEVRIRDPRELLGKRLLGWLSWRTRRRHEHRTEILDALLADLRRTRVDHVAVTGDLTNLGLASEVEAAAAWLSGLGPAEHVSVVPGNHDAYAGDADPARWWAWAAYMTSSDAGPELGVELRFPYVRRAGPLALVGTSSARPTPPLLATGRLGRAQSIRLEALLARLGEAGLCRVVLVHHPPLPAGQSRRRRLDDAARLRAVLARSGAELVLHGHTHRSHRASLPGPRGPIPVLGVPSSSALGSRPEKRARYHVYRVEPATGPDGPTFRISWSVRGYDPVRRVFEEESSALL